MGVDTRLTIPSNARLRDVANVIGLALGCLGYWTDIPSLRVEGVSIDPSSVPECADIHITQPDGTVRFFMYHFEWGNGERGISLRSTAKNIALAVRVASTLGGFVDFSDCDDVECDFGRQPYEHLSASDGEPWRKLQERVSSAQPLTDADIKVYEDVAAYGLVAQ